MKAKPTPVTSKGQGMTSVKVRRPLRTKKNPRIALGIEDNGEWKRKVPRYRDINTIVGKAGKSRKRLSWHGALDTARADILSTKIA